MDLTPDQINQLQSLGITIPTSGSVPPSDPVRVDSHIDPQPEPAPIIPPTVPPQIIPPSNPTLAPTVEVVPEPIPETPPEAISKPITNPSEEIKVDQENAPILAEISPTTPLSTQSDQVLKKPTNPIVPILSITGLTAISFGGLLLFKSKDTPVASTYGQTDVSTQTGSNQDLPVSPTQVPKSIQHYLLTSQQYFTQALQIQNTGVGASATNQNQMADMVNQSILAATDGIKEFPQDPRGWEQRGRIYQSLVTSQPQMLKLAISDFSQAAQLDPSSVDAAHTLASLYAQAGDVNSTLLQLNRIVAIEPTKAQNFYDLARLQQQTGHLPQALDAYNHLLTLLTDPTQKQQVETEKSSLEKLVAQSPGSNSTLPSPSTSNSPLPASSLEGNLIQASADSNLIIAAPEVSKKIEVTNLTSSNALAGTATLTAGSKQISLTNTNLVPTSQVYLTVIKGGKNLVLQVLSRSGNDFIVGLDSPTNEDIEFKWWIVN